MELPALPILGNARAMAKNTSIALGEPFVRFAQHKVASGEFGSTSEVVREAMRRYIAEDQQRDRLLALIDEGLASPIDEGFDLDTWFEAKFGDSASG